MGYGRFMITLYDDERRALWELAKRERRDPREQAALAIRRDLAQRGLLQDGAEVGPEPGGGEVAPCQS